MQLATVISANTQHSLSNSLVELAFPAFSAMVQCFTLLVLSATAIPTHDDVRNIDTGLVIAGIENVYADQPMW